MESVVVYTYRFFILITHVSPVRVLKLVNTLYARGSLYAYKWSYSHEHLAVHVFVPQVHFINMPASPSCNLL